MKLKLYAMLMICLVVFIPVYSASVFAGIVKVDVKGSDGIKNYAKEEDYIDFHVTANLDNDNDIGTEQVWLGTTYKFSSCSAGIEGFECSLRYPADGTTEFMPSQIPYTINLYNDNKELKDSYNGNLIIDNLAPEIKSLSAPSGVGGGEITFSYSIEDYSYAAGDTSKCSGIKKIVLSAQEGSYEKTIDINEDDCAYSGSYSESTDSFSEGMNYINTKAYDSLEHESPVKTIAFEFDKTPPEIDVNSFKFVDAYNEDVNYISINPLNVYAVVNVIGDGLAKVYGDFSEFQAGSYLEADCAEIESGVSECIWQITIKSENEGMLKAEVTAEDAVGNKQTKTLAANLILDVNGPVISSLATNKAYNGEYYAKAKGNNFTAAITDEAGVRADDMILHVSSAAFKANKCEEGWACYWNNIDISSSGTVKAYIGSDSKDRLGNSVEEVFYTDVIIDNTAPKLINLSVESIGGEEEAASYIKTGDQLSIVAELEEDDGIAKAAADLSAIISDADSVEADSCTEEEGKWLCMWITAPIDITGYINDYIYLNFEDAAGNSLSDNEKITVYGLDESEPNYWKNTVSCSPSKIDRQTAPLIEQKVFCHVDLTPQSASQDPEVLSIGLTGCEEADYVQEVSLMNDVYESTDPYLMVLLEKSDMKIDSIELGCSLGIISKVGNKITQYPEEENASITILLYNLPLGELSESVQDKIEEAKDDADAWYLKIAKLKGILEFAEGICRLIGTYNKIVMFLGTIEELLTATEWAAPAGVHKFKETVNIFDVNKERLTDSLYKFCKYISCDRTLWGSWYNAEQSLLGKQLETIENGKTVPDVKKAAARGMGNIDFAEKWHLNPWMWPQSPKESIVLSLATGCLPGIINGAERYRQIQCNYGVCIRDSTTEFIPLKVCEDQKSYLYCKFVFGEAFQLVPYSAFVKNLLHQITYVLSDPVGLFFGIANFVCTAHIWKTEKHVACVFAKAIPEFSAIIGDFQMYIDDFGSLFSPRNDMCKELGD